MFVLLDENLLSKKLKQPLIEAGHLARNVEDMGWRGKKDRELLRLAEAYPFDVFITADKNLPYQQNLQDYQLKIFVLNTKSTFPLRLLPLMIKIGYRLNSIAVEADSVMLIDDHGKIVSFRR